MAEQRNGDVWPGISRGNLLTIALLLCSLVAGWTRMEAALADHERRIEDGEKNLKEVLRDQRNFEAGFSGLHSDVKHLLAEVSRTPQTIECLEHERGERDSRHIAHDLKVIYVNEFRTISHTCEM